MKQLISIIAILGLALPSSSQSIFTAQGSFSFTQDGLMTISILPQISKYSDDKFTTLVGGQVGLYFQSSLSGNNTPETSLVLGTEIGGLYHLPKLSVGLTTSPIMDLKSTSFGISNNLIFLHDHLTYKIGRLHLNNQSFWTIGLGSTF